MRWLLRLGWGISFYSPSSQGRHCSLAKKFLLGIALLQSVSSYSVFERPWLDTTSQMSSFGICLANLGKPIRNWSPLSSGVIEQVFFDYAAVFPDETLSEEELKLVEKLYRLFPYPGSLKQFFENYTGPRSLLKKRLEWHLKMVEIAQRKDVVESEEIIQFGEEESGMWYDLRTKWYEFNVRGQGEPGWDLELVTSPFDFRLFGARLNEVRQRLKVRVDLHGEPPPLSAAGAIWNLHQISEEIPHNERRIDDWLRKNLGPALLRGQSDISGRDDSQIVADGYLVDMVEIEDSSVSSWADDIESPSEWREIAVAIIPNDLRDKIVSYLIELDSMRYKYYIYLRLVDNHPEFSHKFFDSLTRIQGERASELILKRISEELQKRYRFTPTVYQFLNPSDRPVVRLGHLWGDPKLVDE